MNQPISRTEAPEHIAIKAAINAYFLGHAQQSASVMRTAFHDSARIEGNRQDAFASWTVDEFCGFFKGTPAADESTRVRTIDWIDFDGDAGAAKATLVHGQTTFTDYFVLLKIKNEWKVANKAYSARSS